MGRVETMPRQAHAVTAPVTIITSTSPTRLAKQFRLVDGELKKEGAGQMAAGNLAVIDAPTPADLARILQSLSHDQALVYGLPKDPGATSITSAKRMNRLQQGSNPPGANVITRTAENFTWHSGAGYLMLDYDPPPGCEALTRDRWLEALFTAVPRLRDAPAVWAVSASSEIWEKDTQHRGVSGQRLYVLVEDARDIPRAGQALFDRLWLAGQGYCQVSKSGALLQRAPIDASVWQTNRLDFAAPPVCEPPLEARRPDPLVFNDTAPPLDSLDAIPPLAADEEKQLVALRSKRAAAPDVQAQREHAQTSWLEERMAHAEREAAEAGEPLTGQQRDDLRDRLATAVQRKHLFGDFELTHDSGRTVTVGELLDHPERWHNQRFADPLEPDYSNGDTRIAWANLRTGTSPYLYSHAHGGQRFKLLRPTRRLDLDGGESPRAVGVICERLRIEGDVFERAGRLVRLSDGELIDVELPWLQMRLEEMFELFKYDGRAQKMRRVDCPEGLAKKVIAARGTWGLPKVTGIIKGPVIRPGGSLLSEPGFDSSTGLLYVDERPQRPTARALQHQELRDALQRIWEPFRLFPFTDDLSRSVFLAALLTTACRPTLDTAPAFLIRAHAAGTGKTRLCECLMDLVDAPRAAMPMAESSDENEKRLFAKLLSGRPGLILDNLKGRLDSAALCAFMTSAQPEGRILGHTRVVSARNRVLWTLSGNNVVADGDTFRRVLPITLDAGTESPETRKFPFDPRDVIAERIDDYRADLLSVLLSYVAAGMPQGGTGSIGSFEQWERLVRQCVVWLIAQGVTPAPMADPADVIRLSRAEDPARVRHAALLQAWHDLYGGAPVQVRTIATLVNRGEMVSGVSRRDDLENAFIEAAREVAEIRGTFNARTFGAYLTRNQGVVVEGLRVDQAGNAGKRATWQVYRVAQEAAA